MNSFTAQAKAKGWKMKDIAERWGITPRRLSQIAAEPKRKDWDALAGLPNLKEAQQCVRQQTPNTKTRSKQDGGTI